MSVDNGIYIGRFKSVDGDYSYRVIHAQAIENCDPYPDHPKENTLAYQVLYFNNEKAKIFDDENDAWTYARNISKTYTVLEYGVSQINYDKPFPNITREKARQILDGKITTFVTKLPC